MFEQVKVATRISSKLSSYSLDQAQLIQKDFEELIGRPVGDAFTLIPPFYADHGLNITVGRTVFIGAGCAFTGHAPIAIADQVMIAHKVNLVTAGHPVEPDLRRSFITAAPITLERNVWIGAAATILQGVTIGADSVVAAGAVVTNDVPPSTVVAGVPATVIKELLRQITCLQTPARRRTAPRYPMMRRLQRCQVEPSAFVGGKSDARPVRFSAATPVAMPCTGPPRMVPAAAPSNRFAHGWQTGRPVTVVVTAGDLRHSLHVSATEYPRSTVLTGNDRARRANLPPITGVCHTPARVGHPASWVTL